MWKESNSRYSVLLYSLIWIFMLKQNHIKCMHFTGNKEYPLLAEVFFYSTMRSENDSLLTPHLTAVAYSPL